MLQEPYFDLARSHILQEMQFEVFIQDSDRLHIKNYTNYF
jgi:hypothetical protein